MPSEHSYRGRHAAFYDVIYAEKPYEAEAKFVDHCIRQFSDRPSNRMLELACGTGSHATVFAKLGYRITATDYAPEMLDVARAKASKEASNIEFLELDMRQLPVSPEPYDVVVCLFDSIGYVQTDRALDDVLAGVRANLKTNGLFIFEFWHAPAMLHGFDPVRVRSYRTPNGQLLRIAETTLDRNYSLARVSYSILELRSDHTYESVKEIQVNRFFTISEMQALAARHGFKPAAWYGGFERNTVVTDDTWHVLTIWKKM